MAKAKIVKSKVVDIKIKSDDNLQAKRTYSNYVEVHHTPWDFSLRFSDAPPIYDKREIKSDGSYSVPLVKEIVIPVSLVPGLIEALKKQLEKFNKDYGKTENAKSNK